jgi:hypothetical protein
VHLRPSAERAAAVEELAAALSRGGGGRVGLAGVLVDLDRRASAVRVPGRAARWGFRWDVRDERDRRWWPQGITTSADHDTSEVFEGRRVLLTSWYAKDSRGVNQGSRVTVVVPDEEGRLRYRHVLLVDVVRGDNGEVDVQPLRVHAGGLLWHGDHLYVAGTSRGMATCNVGDALRVGEGAGGPAVAAGLGYRYLLPVRFTYDALTDDGHERLRYSFLSLSRRPSGSVLVAGEYGRGAQSTRLVEFAIDPETSLLQVSADGLASPISGPDQGVHGMQGAAEVDGRWYVTTSAGPYWRGSLYVGEPGSLRRRRWVLPVGVEDVTYWPSRDELWSQTEHPGRRFVFTMDRSRLG